MTYILSAPDGFLFTSFTGFCYYSSQLHSSTSAYIVVYYESIKRELKIRSIYECRCDERLQTCKIADPRGLSVTPWGFTTHTYKTLSLAMLTTFIPNSNSNQPCFYLSHLSSPIFSFYILFIQTHDSPQFLDLQIFQPSPTAQTPSF